MDKVATGLLIVMAVFSLACFGGGRYVVKNTPEGNACVRECMAVKNTCLVAQRGEQFGAAACAKQERDCRGTCPGAEWVEN